MEAASQFMLACTGLHTDDADTTTTMHLPRQRERLAQVPRRDPGCPWCSAAGQLGRGDRG